MYGPSAACVKNHQNKGSLYPTAQMRKPKAGPQDKNIGIECEVQSAHRASSINSKKFTDLLDDDFVLWHPPNVAI